MSIRDHQEEIQFLFFSTSSPLILCYPWLCWHDSHISLSLCQILGRGLQCLHCCLFPKIRMASTEAPLPEPIGWTRSLRSITISPRSSVRSDRLPYPRIIPTTWISSSSLEQRPSASAHLRCCKCFFTLFILSSVISARDVTKVAAFLLQPIVNLCRMWL